jgi:hypothetical protein
VVDVLGGDPFTMADLRAAARVVAAPQHAQPDPLLAGRLLAAAVTLRSERDRLAEAVRELELAQALVRLLSTTEDGDL